MARQLCARVRGWRSRGWLLHRQQVPAGSLSGDERGGGRVDPGYVLVVEPTAVGARVGKVRDAVGAHTAREVQRFLLGLGRSWFGGCTGACRPAGAAGEYGGHGNGGGEA